MILSLYHKWIRVITSSSSHPCFFHVRGSLHLTTGWLTCVLLVRMYSYTKLRICVSFILDKCCVHLHMKCTVISFKVHICSNSVMYAFVSCPEMYILQVNSTVPAFFFFFFLNLASHCDIYNNKHYFHTINTNLVLLIWLVMLPSFLPHKYLTSLPQFACLLSGNINM